MNSWLPPYRSGTAARLGARSLDVGIQRQCHTHATAPSDMWLAEQTQRGIRLAERGIYARVRNCLGIAFHQDGT
jgi:hypothetical protein